MDWYEPEIRALEAARTIRLIVTNPVIFYGSSTLRLWECLGDDLASPRVINLGFGGSTLEACMYFFERLVVPETPSSLVIYAGDNDLGDGRSPEMVSNFFSALAEKVSAQLGPVPFGFISIKPSPARAALLDRIKKANRLIEQQMRAIPNGYFIDLFGSMLTRYGAPRAELFEADGLHMNRAGYRLWVEQLLPFRHRMFTVPSFSVQAGAVSLSQE